MSKSDYKLTLPDEFDGHELIVSYSGGKDSTAVVLALRESGLPFRAVFADTGWEHPAVYEYLTYVEGQLGITIDRVGFEGGMVAKVRARAGFPARLQRWCTQELKVQPLKEYHDKFRKGGTETVSVLGIRADESATRAKQTAIEDSVEFGGYVWRPILDWSVPDVLMMHNRHGLKVNPLYQMGLNRVGCFPCIYASKEEIKMMGEIWPERVDQIAELEEWCTAERERRNREENKRPNKQTGLRYNYPASFFLTKDLRPGRSKKTMNIRDIMDWAQTSRGGRQYVLFERAPEGGCMRWGLCDLPANPNDSEKDVDTPHSAE